MGNSDSKNLKIQQFLEDESHKFHKDDISTDGKDFEVLDLPQIVGTIPNENLVESNLELQLWGWMWKWKRDNGFGNAFTLTFNYKKVAFT